MCTDRMASTIGYFSEDGMPMKHLDKTTCGICGELNVGTDENGQPEKQVKVSKQFRTSMLTKSFHFSINFHAVIFSMNSVFEVGSLLERNKLVLHAKKKSI